MFEVIKTYYDSPKEDCSGYYSDILEVPTAKEAWYTAFHINRLKEPVTADVDLRSGKQRYYLISYWTKNDNKKPVVYHDGYWNHQTMLEHMAIYREIKHNLTKQGFNNYHYELEIK